jgi:hypothetical protein
MVMPAFALGAIGGVLAMTNKAANDKEASEHPLATALKYLSNRDLKLYQPLTISLATARTDLEFQVAGDTFLVTGISGSASIKFQYNTAASVDLTLVRSINTPFASFFLTNTAQAGKTLTILVGRDAAFVARSLEAIKLADLNGLDIDPVIKGQFVPLAKATQRAVAETGGVDILGADLTPTNNPCLFRVMVMLSVAGVFSAQLKNGGTSVLNFNGGVALTAGAVYMFDHLMGAGDTVNYQTDVSANVTLQVQEIVAGAQ